MAPPPLTLTPLATAPDPADAFAAVAARRRDVFWLDAGPAASGGWSWVGWGEAVDADHVRAVHAVGDRAVSDSPALDAGPFRGGWVGWAGYESGATRAAAPVHDESGEVDGEAWLRVRGLVAFDHATGRAWSGGEADVITAAPGSGMPVPADRARDEASAPARPVRSRHTPDEYAALIERCRDAIRAGDAYQLCLTTRFAVEGDIDAVATFLALRAATPAHHGGIIRIGEAALVSASPERFLQVEGDTVRTRPIKGTRPRGSDAATDAALAAELRADVKERAENVMIVDLMRNDLSRVCVPASVRVEKLLEVESYSAVHQLVSTVAGTLPATATVGDLLDAAFPAGSMTGAPKLSAMTLLHALEGGPRGVYAGCFGWVGAGGGLDLAMVIRSIVVHPGGAYVGAGGGITWRSVAAAEVAEVGLKARAPLAALGAAVPAGW
ncbi:anthranilate synthase component I family protein [Microbacterium sp.]|uniref:anthranilate synthase component I family protein n=1 Tax=Microbacterium sp. TaxID=51671 RepID=UPI003A94DE22